MANSRRLGDLRDKRRGGGGRTGATFQQRALASRAQPILKEVMGPSGWDAFMASNPPGWADDDSRLEVTAIALAPPTASTSSRPGR